MAEILAGEVVRVIGKMRPIAQIDLAVASQKIALKRKAIPEHDLEVARQILAGNPPADGNGPFSWVVG